MGLTATNAAISIQDGNLPAVNLTPFTSIGQFTPGATVTFALQNTQGIAAATYVLNCPRYPGLHQMTFDWKAGMVNAFSIVMPANAEVANPNTQAGILVGVTISDGASSIASNYNYLQSKAIGAGADFQYAADYVILAALPAYTASSGVLTGNANGAITSSMADGQTPAVGDTFLLPPGIAAAGVDVGLYVITAVGSAGAVFTAIRATGWGQGQIIPVKAEVLIDRGNTYAKSTWVNTLTGTSNAVGTASFTLYPRMVCVAANLSASGNVAITTIPILSATKTAIFVGKLVSGGTITSTVRYELAGQATAGALGTATFTAQASVAAGTANSADQSTVQIAVFNQV